MRISPQGIELIKRFEGLELEAYQDIAGVWTIGYGHTGADVRPGMRISEKEAEDLLKRDLRSREDAVERFTRVSLNQNEFDALVSFVYNVGAEAFRRSTVLRRLNAGNRLGAADALTWWNKATLSGVLTVVKGLVRRRAAERALFLTPTNPPVVADTRRVAENSRVTPVEDPPRRPGLGSSRTIQGATVAGGAGAAASTMGREDAQELDTLETKIEKGTGLTAGDPTSTPVPPKSNGAPPSVGDNDAHISGGGAASGENDLSQTVGAPTNMPAKHEQHAVDSQIQFALLVLVILAVLYIIFARIDDWTNYRR